MRGPGVRIRVDIPFDLLTPELFMNLIVLAVLTRELCRQSFQAAPDLNSSVAWDAAADEFKDHEGPGTTRAAENARRDLIDE